LGMLDEIPPVQVEMIKINDYSKLVCYTDGLSDLRGDDGKEIQTREIIRYIKNSDPVEANIGDMLVKLGIPDSNPDLFDDVSIMAVDLLK